MLNRRGLLKGTIGSKLLLFFLFVLLIGLLSATALAQDDGINFEPVGEEFDAVDAPASSTTIRVSRDTYVSSNFPTTNYGYDAFMRFGMRPTGLGATRPMFYFNMAAIPSQAHITKAELHILLRTVSPSGDCGRSYAAHSLTQSWSETSVTWNSMPSWGSEIGRSGIGCNVGWQVTDITNLARDWHSNPGANNGVILIGDERPGGDFERAYDSKENSSGAYPRLIVQYENFVDTTAPVVNITQPTPAGVWSPADFVVSWDGYDPNNPDGSPGSGIKWFDVYYSLNSGSSWSVGRAQVTSKQTNVTGADHLERIDFYARAQDNAGNQASAPTSPSYIQSWTRIDAEAPDVRMHNLPEHTPSTTFPVSWQDYGNETGESGIKFYDVQYRQDGGAWTGLVYGTTSTTATFAYGQHGRLYEFRARGVDNVGNEQPWGETQAETVVWTVPLAKVLPFDPPIYQKLNGPETSDQFTVRWEALIAPGASVQSFDVRYQRPENSTWFNFAQGTQQTSKVFQLDVNDPDGTYVFQARATAADGTVGPYTEELEARIIVDRHPPFMEERIRLPIIFGN